MSRRFPDPTWHGDGQSLTRFESRDESDWRLLGARRHGCYHTVAFGFDCVIEHALKSTQFDALPGKRPEVRWFSPDRSNQEQGRYTHLHVHCWTLRLSTCVFRG